MDLRPIWRGQLRLALVSCPIAFYSARQDGGSVHFHLINPETGNRVRMVTRDAETDREVSRGDLVKGYEFKKDHYLLLDDEDFEAAKVESSAVLAVEKFVDAGSIEPIYFDSSYFVAPDGNAGLDVYLVLHEAISRARKMALSRVVIAQRERAVALEVLGRGLVAHTLHEVRDLRNPDEIFKDVPTTKADPAMVKLAMQLIDRQSGRYDPADIDDRYEARLRAVIDAKLKGEGVEPEVDEPDTGNVIDLMSALKKSLGDGGKAAQPVTKAPKRGGRKH
ncbi:MAG TPA: Ku protein [Stellaceae bacterium]|nr:Ku protein [Stellaceae bacterium]